MSTLREVAQSCGVSVQTVSRIFNGGQRHRYRASTCERVHAAARALGYRPSGVAQAMRARRLASLGWFSCMEPEFGHITGRLWSGIQHALLRREYNLISGVIPLERPPDTDRLPAILHQKLVAGLLVNFTHHIPAWIGELLAAENRPAVWINVDRPVPAVRLDDEAAAFALTEAFLAAGHRRIAYVDFASPGAPDLEPHYSVFHRRAGYERAMRAAGRTPRALHGAGDPTDGQKMAWARALLAGDDRPTAVVAYDVPHSARPLVFAGHERRAPPTAIGVFGPDPWEEGGRAHPTAVEPEWDLGARAAEKLLDWVETGEAPAPVPEALPIPLVALDRIAPPA